MRNPRCESRNLGVDESANSVVRYSQNLARRKSACRILPHIVGGETMGKLLQTPLARAWRSKGMDAKRFAEACNLSLTYVYDLAAGRRKPSADTLARICLVLDKRPEELFPDIFTRNIA